MKHKDFWVGIAVAATLVNIWLVAQLGVVRVDRDDAQSDLVDARSNLDLIAKKCTLYVDGSLNCPAGTVYLHGHPKAS